MTSMSISDLAARWAELRTTEPNLRIRDAALRLGTSEAELVATRLGQGVTRLHGPWPEIIGAVGGVGEVMALTRNDSVVHERHGIYGKLSVDGHVGLIVGEDIDLRIFFGPWAYGFAVTEDTKAGPRSSLQFFDGAGQAVHKIYATEKTDAAAFKALAERFRAPEQSAGLAIKPAAPKAPPRPDAEIDTTALRTEWAALQDTHDFFPLLRKHKVAREQAFRLAGRDFAVPVSNDSTRRMMEAAAASDLPIMVFVGNPGMIQIHTGTVKRLVPTGPWFNVLDPMFNLHLREDAIASSWLVRKPSVDGTVTSLELFDKAGELIVSFFGKRKPGHPELQDWRALAESLVTKAAA
ncbi:ChuX/HutX family heme-like substrate-binding protein [Ferrovibrio terrae]|uniref:hemin-degrading factor n=1 Tax=Ferrovibrio terrae TaxID=2594003 RepID=UPI003137908E